MKVSQHKSLSHLASNAYRGRGWLSLRCLLAIALFLALISAPVAVAQQGKPNPLRPAATPRVAKAVPKAEVRPAAPAKAPARLDEGDREIELREPLRFPARRATFLGPDDESQNVQTVDYGRSILQDVQEDADKSEPMTMGDDVEVVNQGDVEYATNEIWGGGDCCGGNGCVQCLFPCPRINWDNFVFETGVQGFTGPFNRGGSGSFGFNQSVNWSIPMPCSTRGFGIQIGYRAVQTNFSGAEFTDETRNQSFVTGGIFRRCDAGIQGGIVVDYLYDDWYSTPDLTQVRGEIAWVAGRSHELGFWFTSSTKTSQRTSQLLVNGALTSTSETWGVTDMYAFFYRKQLQDCGATARFFAGFTEDSDGLIGSDIYVPICDNLALQSEFTYLIPEQNRGTGNAFSEEAWNVGFSLVWFPGCRGSRSDDYYRPLFRVANNGTFMMDRE